MEPIKFSTEINPLTKEIIDRLQEKTGVNKKRLTEMAFKLLEEYYARLGTLYDQEVVSRAFSEMVQAASKRSNMDLKKIIG